MLAEHGARHVCRCVARRQLALPEISLSLAAASISLMTFLARIQGEISCAESGGVAQTGKALVPGLEAGGFEVVGCLADDSILRLLGGIAQPEISPLRWRRP